MSADIAALTRSLRTPSPRDREVFRFLAQDMSNRDIAYKTGPDLHTIKVHRDLVMHKMQAKTLAELACFVQRIGLVPFEC